MVPFSVLSDEIFGHRASCLSLATLAYERRVGLRQRVGVDNMNGVQ